MAKIKKRKQDLSRDEAHIKPPELSDAAWEIIREIEENERWKQFDKMASFHDGKLHLPGAVFLAKMHVLSALVRPDNPSPYMIEYVRVGKTIFLHLVEKPPREVLEAMVREGVDNYSSSNDISQMVEGLGDSVGIHGGKSGNQSHNPYKPGTKYHAVFEMASDWIPFRDLLSRIRAELCEGDDDNARSLLGLVAKRNGRSHLLNRKSADGVRMVRAVPGPATN